MRSEEACGRSRLLVIIMLYGESLLGRVRGVYGTATLEYDESDRFHLRAMHGVVY